MLWGRMSGAGQNERVYTGGLVRTLEDAIELQLGVDVSLLLLLVDRHVHGLGGGHYV